MAVNPMQPKSNVFLEKIQALAREVILEEGPDLVKKVLGEQVEELLDQLVPLEVARQLHKVLAGEDLPRGGGAVGSGRKGKKAKPDAKFVCPRKPHRGRCGPKCRKAAGIPDGKDPVSDIAGAVDGDGPGEGD